LGAGKGAKFLVFGGKLIYLSGRRFLS
jgi:hypothetical protein